MSDTNNLILCEDCGRVCDVLGETDPTDVGWIQTLFGFVCDHCPWPVSSAPEVG
jgi:hypothetical protein